MTWWRVLAKADPEPERAVLLRLFRSLPPVIRPTKPATILPYLPRVARFKARLRRHA